jgi:hypothetical protein
MKMSKILLCAALTAACFAGAGETSVALPEKAPGAVALQENPNPLVGSVKIGNATYLSAPGGKTDVLIQNGNSVIYQQNGISTFTSAENGKMPQFIHDARGRVVGPLTPAQTPKIVRNPNPVQTPEIVRNPNPVQTPEIVRNPNPVSIRPNAPSPVVRPESPGFSTMPSSPFLRGNPGRR